MEPYLNSVGPSGRTDANDGCLRRRGWAASPICSAQGCPTKSGSAPVNAVRTTLQRVLCDVPAMRKGPLS